MRACVHTIRALFAGVRNAWRGTFARVLLLYGRKVLDLTFDSVENAAAAKPISRVCQPNGFDGATPS